MAAKTKAPQADFWVSGGGSLYVLQALNASAKEWIETHVADEGFQPEYPNRLYVEHRYIMPIVEGIRADGMVVR